jgi:uncharacterized protein YecE (DUF72 family)
MNIHVGTSGWSYREWKGAFYPPDLSAAAMLRFYASRFSTVEVNNSFYRTPSERVLLNWAEQVPAEFRFVMKASRRITHNSRLTDEDGSLGYFLRAVTPLGPRLGPTLFQLPPTFPKDLIRLQGFLERLPRRWPAAIEFRHLSWFEEPVYELLRAHDVALVTVDADEGDETRAGLVPTASWGYLRLRRAEYDRSSLEQWSRRIQEQPWSEAYVFLKHEEGSPRGPGAAELFRSVLPPDMR